MSQDLPLDLLKMIEDKVIHSNIDGKLSEGVVIKDLIVFYRFPMEGKGEGNQVF